MESITTIQNILIKLCSHAGINEFFYKNLEYLQLRSVYMFGSIKGVSVMYVVAGK